MAITVNVNSEEFELTEIASKGEQLNATEQAQKRYDKLNARVGEKKMPNGYDVRNINRKWGLAKLCRDIISNEIQVTLDRRNGARLQAQK